MGYSDIVIVEVMLMYCVKSRFSRLKDMEIYSHSILTELNISSLQQCSLAIVTTKRTNVS